MKSERHLNRRWSTLTEEDVQAIADATPPEVYMHGGLGGGPYMPAPTGDLVGKKLEMVFDDGYALTYEFPDAGTVRWSANGLETHDDPGEVFPSTVAGVYFINHYCRGSKPPEAHMIVVDTENGLVTACIATLCAPFNAKEVDRDFHFGILKGYADPGYRHDYTEDMVGKAIYWTYLTTYWEVKHIYSTPTYYTVSGVREHNTIPWCASNPADYIKIRDGLYIFSFVEDRQAGSQGFFLMDLYKLHDVGSFFGLPVGNLECYAVGAKGRWTTMYTLPSDRVITEKFGWEE